MRRMRNTKIIATLGPASASPATVRALFDAGADVFRLNFSHGKAASHRRVAGLIQGLEASVGRPIGVIGDLQGPKVRIGTFAGGAADLRPGKPFRLDLDSAPGSERRVALPHPEVFSVLSEGDEVLLNDGRVHLRVERAGADGADTRVLIGGKLSDHKGANFPGLTLPLKPMTEKDRADLDLALELGLDWVALSFVQHAEDVAEVRARIAGRAGLLSKIEKPAALGALDDILALSDGLMVARGDLGVEMPLEAVPGLQKRLVRTARAAGKPVVVATQMLESMIQAPTPTRAEVSDVATAVYDGADAVMLSAESAVGAFPVAAVETMDRIAEEVEHDAFYRAILNAERLVPEATSADAISAAAAQTAQTLAAAAIIAYTATGSTALRTARERPTVPILCLTPKIETARRLALAWGIHCVQTRDPTSFNDMVGLAAEAAERDGFARPNDRVVIIAGVPFGTPGATNVLRIARIPEQTKKRR